MPEHETDPIEEAKREMPRYKCHKEVHALKIASVDDGRGTEGGHCYLHPELPPAGEGYAVIEVSQDYMNKHEPKAGGYYAVYKDGYTSFSPAKAFEDGYTRIN